MSRGIGGIKGGVLAVLLKKKTSHNLAVGIAVTWYQLGADKKNIWCSQPVLCHSFRAREEG